MHHSCEGSYRHIWGASHLCSFFTHKKNHANLCNGEHRDHPYCYTFDMIMLIILEIASLFYFVFSPCVVDRMLNSNS